MSAPQRQPEALSESPTLPEGSIKLLIFDFDGVLVDTQKVTNDVQYQYFKKKCNLDISLETFASSFSGMRVETILGILEQEKGIAFSQSPKQISQDIDTLVLNRLANQPLLPMPGVVDLLSHSHFRRCIGSNGSFNLLKAFLKSSNLAKFFGNDVFSADMVENPKPAPDIFLYAAQYMGVDAEDCLVIEDSIVGVQAAVAAGIPVVGFLGGSHLSTTAADKLLQAGAKTVFSDMRHFAEYLHLPDR